MLSTALMSKEQELQAVSQVSGPSESELALQETVRSLQQERDALSQQYQAQVTCVDYVMHALCHAFTVFSKYCKYATHIFLYM